MRISIIRYFKGLYRLCLCDCGELIPCVNKKRQLCNFKHGHHTKGKFAKFGSKNNMWIGGRIFHRSSGYWYLTGMYDHPNAHKDGRIPEHVYNFTMFNRCCMLKWAVVHHIDGNPVNNMTWNLMGIMRKDHMTIHLTKDTSGRRCLKCGIDKSPSQWYGNEIDGFVCKKCYIKIWWNEHKSEINRKRRMNRIVTNS